MSRAILIVLDSVGCGGAPDAAAFGDEGANTLAHILAHEAAAGRPLRLPHLDAIGLGAAIRLASGAPTPGLDATPTGLWGAATEISKGKDTPSGHWELTGVPVPFDWHYFPRTVPAFPAPEMAALAERAKIPGFLGQSHAAGIAIVEALGGESVATGKPIAYTSVDSVLQLAAHETEFGLDRLYALCEMAADIFHPICVGRVIARPFIGDREGGFRRTAHRRDFAIAPPEPTLLNRVEAAGGAVHAIGKISDIFSGSGVTHKAKGANDAENVDLTLRAMAAAGPGDLIITNLVDFDTVYGHPRDPAGYAENLARFDARLPEISAALRDGDFLILTADHGNDPTWTGTDHTRERVPVLGLGHGHMEIGQVGFADVGASLAAHLGLAPGPHGTSFLR